MINEYFILFCYLLFRYDRSEPQPLDRAGAGCGAEFSTVQFTPYTGARGCHYIHYSFSARREIVQPDDQQRKIERKQKSKYLYRCCTVQCDATATFDNFPFFLSSDLCVKQ